MVTPTEAFSAFDESAVANVGATASGGEDLGTTEFMAIQAAFDSIKHGPLQVLDSQLAALYLGRSPSATLISPLMSSIESLPGALDAGAGYVTIDATAKDRDGAALLVELQAIGLQEGGSFGSMASGLLPIGELAALLKVSDLGFARESGYLPSAGSAMNQGDHAMLADLARANYGVDGTGIKIGILSDSFNNLGGTNADIASGDLPASTTILQDYPSGGTDEGRGMAQLAHDIAPGSPMLFATAFTGMANFANNIIALFNAGARVIADDVTYFAETAYQDGVVAQAIDQVVTNGAVYFSAAANDGHNGFEAAFAPSGAIGSFGESLAALRTGANPYFLPITIPGGAQVTIVLEWNQPAASVSGGSGTQSDVDLFLYNSAGTSVRAQSIANNIGGDPVEIIQFTNSGGTATFNLAVGLFSGPAPTDFKLMALDNGAGVTLGASTLNTNDGTVYGHAATTDAIAVGAAYYTNTPAYGVSPPVVEGYSSGGPTRILFDTAGNVLASPDIRQTPQIVAPDGGDTNFFGFDSDGDGKPNFFGTSAAAPDAAAVAALMLQANGALNAGDVLNLLEDSAIDMNNPATPGFDTGFDYGTGYGLIQADKAVQYAATHIIALDSGHGVILGTHLDDIFAGGAGNHNISGGSGIDALDYSASPGAVNLSLASGSGSNGFGGTDTFSSIEKATGSANGDVLTGGTGNDALIGNGGNDALNGSDGADTLNGGAGVDSLVGGIGNDTLTGGGDNDSIDGASGFDAAIYSGAWADYAVVQTGPNTFSLTDNRASSPDGADTLAGVESLVFVDVLAISPSSAVTPAITAFANDGGVIGDHLTNDVDLLISGTAGAAGSIELFDGAAMLGMAVADSFGAWSYQTGILAGGTYNFTAAATDGAGHLGLSSPIFAVTIDTTADGAPAATLTVDDTADHLIDSAEAASVSFTVAGLDGDATAIATFTDGTHSVQVTGIAADGTYSADLTSLASGTVHASLAIADIAGNQAAATGNDVVLATGAATIIGTAGNDLIDATHTPAGQPFPTSGNDTIDGQGGDDTLNGGAGNDSMAGGDGNDVYYVGEAGDQLSENPGAGTDTVNVSLNSYTLGINLENLTFNGAGDFSGTGNGGDNSVAGGSGNDTLAGGTENDTVAGSSGNDLLDGGIGDDSLLGGSGNDTFVVDSVSDHILENAGEGADAIETTLLSFSLASLANVENLSFIGTGNFSGTGNGAPNQIAGADGNDSLSGGAGADTAIGGAGNDVYTVDNAGDVVTEGVGGGTDQVTSSVSFTLAANVENLTLSGSTALNGTGNDLGNVLTGNNGANILSGLDGNDSLSGGKGNDTLLGGAGNDTVNGGAGADSMAGGDGNDNYTVDVAGDLVSENANEGTDLITSSVAYTLSANLENLTLTGSAGLSGTGNTLDNAITGNSGINSLVGLDGNDTINGGSGADSMFGGLGNDLYVIDNPGDAATENANEGTDTIQTSVTYAIGANIENLTLTGSGAINGTGNTLDNLILGNSKTNLLTGLSGNDTLDGGGGADSMTGGTGNDTYFVDNAGDVVTESSGEGIDSVNATLSAYTLAANVENLTYTGAYKLNGLGNDLDNLIAGGAGKDTLNGGAGADILTGGGGADRFVYRPGEIAAGDVIADFSHAQGDKIDVSAIDAVNGGADNTFTFIGTAAFTAAGQLHYVVSGGNVIVEGNTDGLGGANFSIVLDGVGSLATGDFIL